MESIDDLLADIKAEYEEKEKPIPPKKQQPLKEECSPQLPQIPAPQTQVYWQNNLAPSSLEDNLLADIKAEFEEKSQPKPPQKQQPFPEKRSPQLPPIPPRQAQMSWQKTIVPSSAENSLIVELKAEVEEKQKEEELKRQQQVKEEQIRQEQIKQQQRQALTKEAQEWLKKLNIRSEEGLWFEEFAYDYPSKLEAAIDYLQALRETKP
ncbi:salt stress protein, Slr1339 family [Argonema antarcticum]|uniref:salt stress protein, Slr1339 family n=1 Tax=Argonema antarcticum TaxID=2942763 RepID=UPI0020129743|nr:hypothetical protein [Argonema antarcticum]MCL1471284.1 hypothetical protein [Argonema antarcticum A004/B2]